MKPTLPFLSLSCALCFCLVALSCTDSNNALQEPGDDSTKGDAGADVSGEDGTEPVFAVMTQVFDDMGDRLVYVALRKTLDLDSFDFEDGREFPGVANIAGIGGRLFISDGERPVITQYSVTDELEWLEQGRISFQDYPVGDNANFHGQFQIDDTTMYLMSDTTSRLVWDPKALEIKDLVADSTLETTNGSLMLTPAGNHVGAAYSGDPMQAFFYHDEGWFDFGETSFVVVYDRETHAEKAVIEAPCPGLAVNSMDEEGNWYFSAWDYTPLLALYGDAIPPCVVRVTKEGELDPSFDTDLSKLTGGRHVMNFRYVRDGWGFADVVHHELLDADFEGELDPAVLDQIWFDNVIKLWRIDVANGTAERFQELGETGMGWRLQTVDDRTFVFTPSPDWSASTAFELDAEGNFEKLLETRGDISWIKTR